MVIGNSNYKAGRLPNPVNDAQAIASKLKQLGWKVIERENVGRDEMIQAATEFGSQLAAGGEGLFYYAGHGVQSGNVNYLIPVDADIQDEDELPAQAYDAGDILKRMENAKNLADIVILDACRNNPFASRFSSAGKGLAGMEPPGTTPMYISFATGKGITAADGLSGNGLYTSELLQAMSVPGKTIEEVFKAVRAEVRRKSGGKQIPFEGSTLVGDLYFNPTPEQAQLQLLVRNSGPDNGQARSFAPAPVLVSRTLFDNFQLSANLALAATLSIGKFSSDSTSFITATQDRKLRIWNTATGAISFSQADFGTPSLSENGRFIVGLPDARTVHVLDTEANTLSVKTYQVGNDIHKAAVSPDGRRLLLYLEDKGFRLYNTDSSVVVGEAREVDGDPHFAFSPAGNRVLLWGSDSHDLYLWDTELGKRIGRTSAHHKPVGLVRFTKDGSQILTAAPGDPVEIWQASDGAELRKLTLADGNPLPTQAEFIDENKHVIINALKSAKTPDSGYMLGVWDTATGKPVKPLLAGTLVKTLHFSPDQQRLFVTSSDSSTQVFDLSTHTQMDALNGAELIGFSSDGRRLIAHDGDGIRLYDAHSLTPVSRMPAQITAFIGPKASNLYATVDSNGGVRLLHFETGNAVSVINKAHIDPVSIVSFAPDGRQLVTFSDDKVAKLWALPTVRDLEKLHKDDFESTAEYTKRVAEWSSTYTALVGLGEYDADTAAYTVKVGSDEIKVPMGRDDARSLAGQREAYLSGRLKFHDKDSLQLADYKLSRVP